MTHAPRTRTQRSARTLRRGLVLLGLCTLLCAVGCSAARSAPNSSAAPGANGAPAGLQAPAAEAVPAPAPAPGTTDAAPKEEASATPALEQQPVVDEEESDRAKKKSGASRSDSSRLTTTRELFEKALEPEQLSCDGARPLRDAICEIAERLCDLSAKSPSSTNSTEECTAAKSSCEQAQRKYKERCGK